MGKTSVSIYEDSTRVVSNASSEGEIAVVFNAKRGRTNKVYTIRSISEFTRVYGDDTSTAYKACNYLLSRGNVLKTIRCDIQPAASETTNAKATVIIPCIGGTGNLVATAVAEGAVYNGIAIKIINQGGVGVDNLFSLEIYSSVTRTSKDSVTTDTYSGLLESYRLVSLNPNSTYYYGMVVNSDIIDLSITGTPDALFASSTAIGAVYVGSAPLKLAGGVGVSYEDTSDGLVKALTTAAGYLADKSIKFATAIVPGFVGSTAWSILSSVVNARKDFEVIVDISSDDDNGLDTISRSTYSAFYSPKVFIREMGGLTYPSIAIADLIGGLHRAKMIYKAPAGIETGMLGNVLDVEVDYSSTKISDLQEKGVNPIIVKTGVGCVVWGQSTSTLSLAAITDLSTRLLTNYFKREVYDLSQQFVFRENNEYTWQAWKDAVDPIIRSVFDVGGIRQYLIKCDRTTMTEEEIAQGKMIGKIIFWPISHVEKIEVTFTVDKTGVSFE